jgi:hypothetical protein
VPWEYLVVAGNGRIHERYESRIDVEKTPMNSAFGRKNIRGSRTLPRCCQKM